MQLSYEKLGSDHKMYGKVDYIVMDGMQAICYKSKDDYLPLEADGSSKSMPVEESKPEQQRAKSLFVLSFTINGETEEITFKSKKKMDKTIAFYKEKEFISDIQTAEYNLA